MSFRSSARLLLNRSRIPDAGRLFSTATTAAAKGRRVVLGMSGGVDSSVSALLLKRQGYDVHGVFMRNWDELDEMGMCTGNHDMQDAERVCAQLGIPFSTVDFVKEYWTDVFEATLSAYNAGFTPNPDVMCNREIKFSAFAQFARERLGAELLATGHYARSERNADMSRLHPEDRTRLLRAVHREKDQTYFLCMNRPHSFDNVLFPIGTLLKPEVRRIARENGLLTADKRESMGLCFVGKRDFSGKFLQDYLTRKPGAIVTLDGQQIGTHEGLWSLTIGQRARIGGLPDPHYAVAKSTETNSVVVAPGHDHPALYVNDFTAMAPSWLAPVTLPLRCRFTTRHRGREGECIVTSQSGGLLHVQAASPHRAVVPGQVVCFYDVNGAECLGGAIIARPGASLWQLGVDVPSTALELPRLRRAAV